MPSLRDLSLSAFWGVVAGAIALFVQQWRPARTA
jgi:predicted benzoate:H+ symporter BenE